MNSLADNEIIKALECYANDRECIHEIYEPACGMWCKLKNKWCTDMSGRSDKENCSEYTPISSMQLAKATLVLINRQKEEIENYSRNNRSLTETLTQMQAALKKQSAEIERLEKHELKEAMILNNETIKRAVNEAIKEFAERLKEELILYCETVVEGSDTEGITDIGFQKENAILTIDNLVKERVGEG